MVEHKFFFCKIHNIFFALSEPSHAVNIELQVHVTLQAVGENCRQHHRHKYEEELEQGGLELLRVDVRLREVRFVGVGLREHVQVREEVGGEVEAEPNLGKKSLKKLIEVCMISVRAETD